MNTAFLESLSAHPLVTSIGWTLVHFVWQATLAGIVVALLLGMMRRTSASVRYVVACGGLCVMTVAPIGTFAYLVAVSGIDDWKLRTQVADVEQPVIESAVAIPQLPGEIGIHESSVSGNSEGSSAKKGVEKPETTKASVSWFARLEAFAGAMQRWLPWCVVVWIAGVLCLAVRLLAGLRRVWLWRSQGVEIVGGELAVAVSRLSVRMNLRQRVRLLETAREAVPAVIGWIRPAILVPASMLSGLTTTELDSILAHELAHIRRYDYLVNLMQTVVETLLFYHPAVWWLSSRIRAERENCCDDIAIAICGNRVVYVQALARMEEIRCRGERLSMAASGGSLVGRVRRIAAPPQTSPGLWWPAGAIVLCTLGILLCGLWMTAALADAGASPITRQKETIELKSDANATQETEIVKANEVTIPVKQLFESYSVSGRVINADGMPVSGARLVSKIWREGSEKPEFIEGISDNDGKFRLQFPSELRYSEMAHTHVYKEGLAVRTVMMKILFKNEPEIDDVEIKLVRGLPTGFRVLQPDGSPCESASVRPRLVEVPNGVFDVDEPTGLRGILPNKLAISSGAKSNSDGWATFDSVAKDMLASVVVEAAGFGTQEFEKTDGVLQLAPSGEIRGKIDAQDAGRFEGTLVWIETASLDPRDDPWARFRKGITELRVDGKGEFQVPEIATGNLRIRFFFWDENADVQPFVERGIAVHSGEILDLRVKTRPTATMSGLVLTSDMRLPVPGARVRLWNTESCSFTESHVTDDSGKYEGKVAPGNLMVQVQLPNEEVWYQKYGFPRLSDIETPIDVETFELPNILLSLKSDEKESWDLQKKVDDDWGELARASGLRSRLTMTTEQPSVGQPLLFKLEVKNFGDKPTGVDGQIYAPFRVLRAMQADGKPAKFIGMTPQTMGQEKPLKPGETLLLWENVDANSLFLLEEGAYKFFAEGGEWAGQAFWRDSNTIEVEIAAGELSPINKMLKKLGEGLPDKWAVSNGMGLAEGWKGVFLTHLPTSLKRDATGIQIWFTDEKLADDFELGQGDQKQIVTGLGKCELGFMNVAAQPKTLEIWPEYLEHIRRAATTSLKLESDTDRGKLPWSAEGTVTDRSGKPVEGATVRAHSGIGTLRETGSVVTGPDGRYRFSFGPGIWSDNESMVQAATISVHLEGHFEKNLHRQGDLLAAKKLPENGETGWGSKTADDVFLPGRTKVIDFVMLPATRMNGVVVGADGDRMDGVRVSLVGEDMPPSSSVVANTRTDKGGRFELNEIPTGFRYQILVEPYEAKPPWLGWASAPMVFVPGDDGEMHIEYSVDGKPVDFSCQQMQLILNGNGVSWKTALKDAANKTLKLQWDGLWTDKMVRAGMASLELGEKSK